jgi:hypothetical protein
MVAGCANVLVRLLVADNPAQNKRAVGWAKRSVPTRSEIGIPIRIDDSHRRENGGHGLTAFAHPTACYGVLRPGRPFDPALHQLA